MQDIQTADRTTTAHHQAEHAKTPTPEHQTAASEAWLSFNCATRSETCEGQATSQCMSALDVGDELVAVGVKCTDPELPNELIPQFAASDRPMIAYPNAGGIYDSSTKTWPEDDLLSNAAHAFDQWANRGTTVLGDCCRSSPERISESVAWRATR
jgi:homocysteine S-methyltransferase